MEPKSNCHKDMQRGKGPLRKSQNAHLLTLTEIISFISIIFDRKLRDEEIKEISENPANIKNLVLKHKSLHDEVNSLKRRKAELKQLVESSQHKGKGWWEVNVDVLNTVEEVQEVAAHAVECQKLLVDHMSDLQLKSSGKKDN